MAEGKGKGRGGKEGVTSDEGAGCADPGEERRKKGARVRARAGGGGLCPHQQTNYGTDIRRVHGAVSKNHEEGRLVN